MNQLYRAFFAIFGLVIGGLIVMGGMILTIKIYLSLGGNKDAAVIFPFVCIPIAWIVAIIGGFMGVRLFDYLLSRKTGAK